MKIILLLTFLAGCSVFSRHGCSLNKNARENGLFQKIRHQQGWEMGQKGMDGKIQGHRQKWRWICYTGRKKSYKKSKRHH